MRWISPKTRWVSPETRWISRETIGALLAAPLLALAGAAGADEAAAQSFDVKALGDWQVFGTGDAQASGDGTALLLREGKDSLGINLVSPEPLPRLLRARLRVKPEGTDGVVVVMLSAAPIAGGNLEAPDGYRGEQSLWVDGGVGSYAFALHTGFHQPNAFLASNPGWSRLVEVPDVASEERWYDVEVGRSGEELWLAVDGTLVFRVPVPDPPGLPAGHLVLRLRGPGDGSFAASLSKVEVEAIGP